MLVQIVTENGQKKIKPLTADAGAGNPVGTIISMYKKSSPSGYLYCDGSTFDQTAYPLLYAYLGSNILPDYREFALVGAEENTTDVYNASTNPTGTIHNHDVYTEGQAKDDRFANHDHSLHFSGASWSSSQGTGTEDKCLYVARFYGSITWGAPRGFPTATGNKGDGNTTRGKRKAVYFYIKATSGLSENAQDNVVAQINEQRSYSTEEHWTGKYWIDGKPIYEKTFYDITLANSAVLVENVSFIVNQYGMLTYSSTLQFPIPKDAGTAGNCTIRRNPTTNQAYVDTSYANYKATITIEYTKTTD